MNSPTVGIYGGGAWGLSLGLVFHAHQQLTALYTSHHDTARLLKEQGKSARLSGAVFANDFPITNSSQDPLQAETLLIASTLSSLASHCARIAENYMGQNIVLCCKGQNHQNGAFPHQIAAQYFPKPHIYLLSGPSFARDLADGNIAAVALAGKDITSTAGLAESLTNKQLRLYASDDTIGVAVGGAYKNVLAIAAGIGAALNIGESAKAALITRGIVELQAISESLGGSPATLLGLSGLGDVILSCNSAESRNFRLGILLGQGMSAGKAIDQIGAITEGYYTAQSVPQICKKQGLELPISQAVYRILYEGLSPTTALQQLISRPGGKRE